MALFDAIAGSYDDWYRTPLGAYADRVEKEIVLDLAAPSSGETAVDLGCGTGQYALALAARGLRVTGVDISARMLDRARARAEETGLAVRWVEADVREVPLPSAAFDLATMVTVLEFVPEPERAVAEALRLLRPGGRLVAAVLGEGSGWARLYREEAERAPDSVFAHARFFTADGLARLLGIAPSEVRKGLFLDPAEAAGAPPEAWPRLDAAARARGAAPGFLAALRRKE
ncbi:class I SAM-dependent methyltransferase [Caldinitratiruptor microaerophilus]|uniref:Ubiquinone biosynthesis protein UbiE n=1 Tax=Caldinitratiruptor microaerophilus TaxID=671077 RepID=A0AA35G7S7_9FIRM|nr:class I SAM-dependent methyltransferase [Caldinitratiruptor microaerophilus]BDG60230.1 ubiquinone biosynthesis protein UbiE [Caldinitratiruptor microaerophilus]